MRMVGSLVTDDPHVRITEEPADYAASDRDIHGILGGDDATTLAVRLFWDRNAPTTIPPTGHAGANSIPRTSSRSCRRALAPRSSGLCLSPHHRTSRRGRCSPSTSTFRSLNPRSARLPESLRPSAPIHGPGRSAADPGHRPRIGSLSHGRVFNSTSLSLGTER